MIKEKTNKQKNLNNSERVNWKTKRHPHTKNNKKRRNKIAIFVSTGCQYCTLVILCVSEEGCEMPGNTVCFG